MPLNISKGNFDVIPYHDELGCIPDNTQTPISMPFAKLCYIASNRSFAAQAWFVDWAKLNKECSETSGRGNADVSSREFLDFYRAQKILKVHREKGSRKS